jgi:formylglycine-generating enzyme required for sulfatase activity
MIASTHRCPSCFAEPPPAASACAACGWQPGRDNGPPFLPLGTLLDGRYRLGRVLGHGGFGITYLAWEQNLELTLAVKEYLPRDLSTRDADGATVSIYSSRGDEFDYGLARFIDEARALARFDEHPGVVGVKNFFRAHGTGYIVMDYVPGITLKDFLERKGGRIPFDLAVRLLMPVMDALRAVHAGGLLHRDIAPDNIRITPKGQVKLLDFGAARQAAGEHSRSLSVLLKPGYAPPEQYRSRGKQGPWTDVYALAATLYRCITGQNPPEALDRMEEDELVAPSRLGVVIPAEAEAALLEALAPKVAERTQDVRSLQADLKRPAAPQPARAPARPTPQPSKTRRRTPAQSTVAHPAWRRRLLVVGWIVAALAAAVLGGAIGLQAWRDLPRQGGRGLSKPNVDPPPPIVRPAAGTGRLPYEPEIVTIPAGTFLMGCQPDEVGCGNDEKPARWVNVSAFGMGKYEVTFAQWDACVNGSGCSYRPDDKGWGREERPVINVSWKDAQQYLRWLSGKTGKAYRLPTEAEWEYAARAGTTTRFSTGDCITSWYANYNALHEEFNCDGIARSYSLQTQAVGRYQPNPWGLHDVHGNISEWVEDCYRQNYASAPVDGSAWLGGDCALRAIRGGSRGKSSRHLRSANRDFGRIDSRRADHGFRVACDL